MKFFVLPPISNLELMDEGTAGYFCLAHLYKTVPEYRKHFLRIRNQKDSFILLDNGAAENSLVSNQDLLEIVEELQPNEVIAPDVLHSARRTTINLIDFSSTMNKRGLLEHTNIFFCPQGNNMEEWMNLYMLGLHNDSVSTIGLSKIALPHCKYGASNDTEIATSRREVLRGLKELDLLKKPLHLLGAETPFEFTSDPVYKHPIVRSTDSCLTVWSAMNEQDWTVKEATYKRVPTPHDYFSRKMTSKQIQKAYKNIKFLDDLIKFYNKKENIQ